MNPASLHPAAFPAASPLLIWPHLKSLEDCVHSELMPSAQPQALGISCCGQCHFPNLKTSSISIDFSSLNCYLLRKVCPVGSVVCLAQEIAGFACLQCPELQDICLTGFMVRTDVGAGPSGTYLESQSLGSWNRKTATSWRPAHLGLWVCTTIPRRFCLLLLLLKLDSFRARPFKICSPFQHSSQFELTHCVI